MNKKMNPQDIARQLHSLNNGTSSKWFLSNDRIKKAFSFTDFKQALDFMVNVGHYAEKLDHHPEWCNRYNKVSIELTTHSAGGITDMDFRLAAKIEEVFNKTGWNCCRM